jgi:hypothetical protein
VEGLLSGGDSDDGIAPNIFLGMMVKKTNSGLILSLI